MNQIETGMGHCDECCRNNVEILLLTCHDNSNYGVSICVECLKDALEMMTEDDEDE